MPETVDLHRRHLRRTTDTRAPVEAHRGRDAERRTEPFVFVEQGRIDPGGESVAAAGHRGDLVIDLDLETSDLGGERVDPIVGIGPRRLQTRDLTGEIDALGEQLEARKVVDRAKGVLIDQVGLSESDAFSFIQRTAMSERVRMRDVADRILDGSLRPG